MPTVETRDYRRVVEFRALDGDDSYIVEGYATTFNDPYVLYRFDGLDYYEEVDPHAFDETDTRDVIFQYDHTGRVLARTKNGTLNLSTDDYGLKVRADLSKSEQGRSLYEDIKNGLVDQMSFGFTVEEDAYNADTRVRRILKVRRLYDVSAVSIPANPNTEIAIRAYFDGVIEAEAEECRKRIEIENKRKALALLLEL